MLPFALTIMRSKDMGMLDILGDELRGHIMPPPTRESYAFCFKAPTTFGSIDKDYHELIEIL